MLTILLRPIALIACTMLTAACAALPRSSAPPTPGVSLPALATSPCRLPLLTEAPTQADLERAYVQRGVALVDCDGARRMAVEGWRAQRALRDP